VNDTWYCQECKSAGKIVTEAICPHCDKINGSVEFKTDLGEGDVMVCEDCYNEIEEDDDNSCGCCRKPMPQGDTWCCEGECGLLTCPDCRPDDDKGACVICQQEAEEDDTDAAEDDAKID
jgi:hypothetical protein